MIPIDKTILVIVAVGILIMASCQPDYARADGFSSGARFMVGVCDDSHDSLLCDPGKPVTTLSLYGQYDAFEMVSIGVQASHTSRPEKGDINPKYDDWGNESNTTGYINSISLYADWRFF